MFHYISVFFLLTILSGCGILPMWATIGHTIGDVILYERTGKTSGEHVLSGVTGEDCKFIRVIDTNKFCMTSQEYEDYLLSLNCDTYTWDVLDRVKCKISP